MGQGMMGRGQPGQGMMGQGMPGPGMMGRGQPNKEGGDGQSLHFLKMCETADAHHAGMLAFSEVRLKITDAQKPAWAKFVEATKTAHQSMAKLCTEFKDKPMPTDLPERLARDERFAVAKLSHLQAMRPALTELYQQLTPEQQKLANSLPLAGHGRNGRHNGM